ncbi:MAG: c-type cytochrome [Pirellulaceae bacterium]
MIWRYHPQTRQYEIFAEGGGNAFGIEIDAAGRLFSGHNGGDTRGFHYVQGGYYQKGTKYGPVSNAFTFGEIGFMPHPPTPRFSHDLVCYEGTALPAQYHGAMFSIDPLKGTVFWVQRSRHGSSFETKDLGQVFQTSDFAFRPVDITVGPDGKIYVADFCEEFIAHGQHFQGRSIPVLDVFTAFAANERTDPVTPNSGNAADDTTEWIHQLTNANRTIRRRTLRQISESKLTAQQQWQLQKWLQGDFGQTSLEALWALNLQHSLIDEQLQSALQHPSADVRRWAVRLAAERPHLPEWLATELPKLAAVEANAEVRSQLASSAKKLSQRGMPDECLAIVVALSENAADLQDPAIPLLIWWAWEATTAYPDSLQRFLKNDALWQKPLFANHALERIARRLASGDQRELALCHAVLNHSKKVPTLQAKVLAGIQQAWETRPLEAVPATLLQSVLDAGGGSLELKIRLGDEQAIHAAFQLMEAATMPSAKHERLLQRLANTAKQDVLDRFLKWLANPDFPANQRATLIAVLAEFDSPEIAAKLLESWDRFDRNQQQVAVRTLVVRSAWSKLLLQQVQAKRIDRALISAEVVRSLVLHQDQDVQMLLRELELSSPADPAAVDEAERQRVVSAAALPNADPYVGEKLFLEHCGKCHQLFRQGGNIGPDLTSYQRNDVERFILNVVAPNLEIREGFETWSVMTDDGRIVNGFMADQDANTVVLRTSDGQAVVIERTAIDQMERSPFSVMPTGITNSLTNDQLRDLFGYLRQSQPVTP